LTCGPTSTLVSPPCMLPTQVLLMDPAGHSCCRNAFRRELARCVTLHHRKNYQHWY
jgi:hypothetical protein